MVREKPVSYTHLKTTSSGNETDAMAAKYAVDGDNGTRWSSNFVDDAWLLVDLGKAYTCLLYTSGEQYQAKTQLTGIMAGFSMIVLLLCGTGFIGYLPIPILTAIVISALMGATEFDLAARLWKVSRTEFLIFMGAFLGVLLLGTINGVLIGIILSFTEMIIRTSKPSRCFLGIQPGHRHFKMCIRDRLYNSHNKWKR